MDPSASTPSAAAPVKETKVKIRRPRQPKGEGASKEKTIKIKLTAKKNTNAEANHYNNNNGGSEEEDDPETATEEQLIFRVPEGELCERLHEMVKKREIPEDVKLNLKGEFLYTSFKYGNNKVTHTSVES